MKKIVKSMWVLTFAFAAALAFAAVKPGVANAKVNVTNHGDVLISGNVKASELTSKAGSKTNVIVMGNTTLTLDKNLTVGYLGTEVVKERWTLNITGNKILTTNGLAMYNGNIKIASNLKILSGGKFAKEMDDEAGEEFTYITGNSKGKVVIGPGVKSITAPNTAKVGTAFNVKANLGEPISGVKYKFVWSKDNWKEWGVAKKASTTNNANITLYKAGKYDIYIDVIYPYGLTETKKKTITVSGASKFKSITMPATAKVNTKFNIKANVNGSTSGIKYKFVWCYNNWKSWGVLRKEGTSNNTNVRMKKAGTYDIYVDVIYPNGQSETKQKRVTIK